MIKTSLPVQPVWLRSLVGEIKSCMTCRRAKKKKKKACLQGWPLARILGIWYVSLTAPKLFEQTVWFMLSACLPSGWLKSWYLLRIITLWVNPQVLSLWWTFLVDGISHHFIAGEIIYRVTPPGEDLESVCLVSPRLCSSPLSFADFSLYLFLCNES